MNRRRVVIGIIGLTVFAAVLIGVVTVLQAPPAEEITVRFHSFSTNGPVLLAFGVVSNATTKDFAVNVSAEYMTNGAVLAAPRYFEIVGGTEHGLVHTTVAPGSNHCRLVVQYRRTSATRVGAMFEVLRTRLFGERPFKRGYSDEFHTPP